MKKEKSDKLVYDVPADWTNRAHVNGAQYDAIYALSAATPETFWSEHGKRIDWIKPFTKVKNTCFDPGKVSIKWFEDGSTNVSMNCIDRHLPKRADQIAIIWEGDDPEESKRITYRQLYEHVSRFANVLKAHGVKKGDTVTIYLPMIPEAAYAMLACARIGAVHSIVFGGFSPESLAGRIQGCQSKIVITADEGLRGGRKVPLKVNVDQALNRAPGIVETVIVVRRTGGAIDWVDGRDVWYANAMAEASPTCPPVEVNAEDPLFILYTSGSTGAPKGVVHTTGGYLVFASMTHQYVFDYHDGDIYWCTADIGWVTGHSYIVYGPLANGATTLMFEGVPNYPSVSRFWESHRQAWREYFLYRAYRHSLPDGGRRGRRQKNQPRFASIARIGGRAHQSRGVGVVSSRRRGTAVPDCRYVVADRDRWNSDHASSGRRGAEAWLSGIPFLWREAGGSGCRRDSPGRRLRRQSCHRRFMARADAHGLRRP